ncbi:MAG: hypothetical protein Q9217_000918 [Psora testacea]
MIELGLARIKRLLKDTPIPWRAIHIAGTNGKGSVCAYASAMLHASNIRCGRFTSPHLIDRWDCVVIDETTVRPSLFHEVEALVKTRDLHEDIKASEFEILTATAFEIFNREKIEVGIVEVGLGGRQDATNVLKQPSITIITKIGEDHQSLLGSTQEEIAYEKAGIMKPHVPCLFDGSNSLSVIKIFQGYAAKCQASLLLRVPHDLPLESDRELDTIISGSSYEPHQIMNIQLAYEAVKRVACDMNRSIDLHSVAKTIELTSWPGRLQMINLERLISHQGDVLIDGAHNSQSAEALGSYVDARLRPDNSTITWVVGFSDGKDARQILCELLRPGDKLIAVRFGQVEGMPWVRSMEVERIIEVSQLFDVLGGAWKADEGLGQALRMAADISNNGPIVIAGSLYLISDVLRLQRDAAV